MPDATIEFAEGPVASPPDDSQVVAVVGFASGMVTGDVKVFDEPSNIKTSAGAGPGPVAAHFLSSRGKRRVLLCATAAVVAGILSAVTQVGSGPICTASADENGPFDDATLMWRIKKGGAHGVATFEPSWSYSVVNGNASPLYQSAIVMPERSRATALGTVDLTSLTYAEAATVTGTVDLTGIVYGAGGDLDGDTLIVDFDNGGGVTTTFSAPANAGQVAAQINAAVGDDVASVNQQNKLVLTSVTLGASSEVDVTGGTGRATLGLSVHTYTGSAGDLDGKTLILDEDTQAPQTVTFVTPGSPDDVVLAVSAKTNITAELFSSKNLLRIVSDTRGSASRLNITGGNGRVLLGLAIPASPYQGAESSYYVPHLGTTITFSSGADATFIAGTVYSATTRAPRPDADAINDAIDALIESGYGFGRILIVQETDVIALLAQAASIDAKMAELESSSHFVECAMIGVETSELDDDVRSTFAAFRSRRIDGFARGAYVSTALVPGGGDTLRSPSWLGALQAALLPLGKDRGDHGFAALPCSGLTVNEQTATTKLVAEVGADAVSWNVIDGKPGRFYFAGGYSFASGSSGYCDQSTRDTVMRAAEVAQATLTRFVNTTSLDTGAGGKLTPGAAAIVDGAVEQDVNAAVVPAAALGVQSNTDRTVDFYSLKQLITTITIGNRTPAREVKATIGPGILSTEG